MPAGLDQQADKRGSTLQKYIPRSPHIRTNQRRSKGLHSPLKTTPLAARGSRPVRTLLTIFVVKHAQTSSGSHWLNTKRMRTLRQNVSHKVYPELCLLAQIQQIAAARHSPA
ncbi:MAG: hypothetical protein KTR25_12195 [Myxococcales bacterium]|nr:hypothetical protein [Myxococcales bacterium]